MAWNRDVYQWTKGTLVRQRVWIETKYINYIIIYNIYLIDDSILQWPHFSFHFIVSYSLLPSYLTQFRLLLRRLWTSACRTRIVSTYPTIFLFAEISSSFNLWFLLFRSLFLARSAAKSDFNKRTLDLESESWLIN